MFWPDKWEEVFEEQSDGSFLHKHDWYNNSYADLNHSSVFSIMATTLRNAKFIREYKNYDESSVEFVGLTAYADNDENGEIGPIEAYPFYLADFNKIWRPYGVELVNYYPQAVILQMLDFIIQIKPFYEKQHNVMGKVHSFNFEIIPPLPQNPDPEDFDFDNTMIIFSDLYYYDDQTFLPNDLFVTVESGSGFTSLPYNSPEDNTEHYLNDVLLHVPMEAWFEWSGLGNTNHATIASEEVGNYYINKDSGMLIRLR